jgi:hypothetical protein
LLDTVFIILKYYRAFEEEETAENPNLSVEDLDKLMTTEFVDWFRTTVNNYDL